MINKLVFFLIDYQDEYTNDANIQRLFPSLINNVKTLLLDARSRFPPENIVHIRSNYNLVFARNFKILHPTNHLLLI